MDFNTKPKNDLSFKEYLDSKHQLHEAIKKDPIHVATYEVYKYCRIAVGETKDLREYHNLKPKQSISVTWRYSDIDELPEPLSVHIPHLTESIEDIPVFQTGERMLKWIRTNAKEV